MPVTSSTPTVSVSVPVPTPVQSKPKKQHQPVSFGGEDDNQGAVATPTLATPQIPPLRRQLTGVILPWSPSPKRMKRLPKKRITFAARINVAQSGENAHQALTRLLGNGSRSSPHEKRLSKNSYVWRDTTTGDLHVRLHGTNVVTAHPNGQVTLNHGGYMTSTTRRFMGYASPAVQNVSFANGKFRILGQSGWEEYENGTRYPPDERQAFEHTISQNPQEATNHEVYADWLDERGHSDEASYHREQGRRLREQYPPEKLSRRRIRSNKE